MIDKVAFDEKLGPKVLMQREQKIVEMMAGDKMKDEAAHLFRMMSAMPAARRMSVMPGIRITDDDDGEKKAMVSEDLGGEVVPIVVSGGKKTVDHAWSAEAG